MARRPSGLVPHLFVYRSATHGWVAQCESLYLRPWTYAGRGWLDALRQGLHHLRSVHYRELSGPEHEGRPRSLHSPGDGLTDCNGRIP